MSTKKKKASKKSAPKAKDPMKEKKSIDPEKAKELQKKIEEIKGYYSEIEKDDKKKDSSGAKIGRLLMEIESDPDEVYKDTKTRSMSGFIKKNFRFTTSYGFMLKEAAKVEKILDPRHEKNLSFSLLQKLNHYSGNPDAVKAIWKSAKGSNAIPTHKDLRKAVAQRKKENPTELKKPSPRKKSWSEFLQSDKATLKAIGYRLVKLENAELQEMDGEVKKDLVAKIQTLLG